MEDYSKIRDVNANVGNKEIFLVQVMETKIIERSEGANILKCVFLDRSIPFDAENLTPYDEIEMVCFIGGYKKANDTDRLKTMFTVGKILIIQNIPQGLKQSNNYNVLPHHYSITYTHYRDTPNIMESKDLDVNVTPIDKDRYIKEFPFIFDTLEDLAVKKRSKTLYKSHKVSCMGIVEHVSSVVHGEKVDKINFELKDSGGHKIVCTIFGQTSNGGSKCSDLLTFDVGDIIYVRGASVSEYNEFTLIINDDTLIIVNPTFNPLLGLECNKFSNNNANINGTVNLSSVELSQMEEITLTTLDEVQTDQRLLSSSDPIRRHEIHDVKILDIDVEKMWRFQCAFMMTKSDGKESNCMKSAKLLPNGTWVCSLDREDSVLPNISFESDEMKVKNRHTGHICDNVLPRLFTKARITDDSTYREFNVYINHLTIEKLLGKTFMELSRMNDDDIKELKDDVIASDASYLITTTSKYSPESQYFSKKQTEEENEEGYGSYGFMSENNDDQVDLNIGEDICFFQINFLRRML